MSQAALFMKIMGSSIAVANKAGSIIREVMSKGELGIVEKGKDDLQTQADRSAQQCIVASLTNLFPNVKIIGEEGQSDLNVSKEWLVTDCCAEFLKNTCPEQFSSINLDDVVIWVDPLDGTAEYTQGFLDHVTVLIGIAIKEKAVGGVIHQPYYNYKSGSNIGRTIWGVQGLGCGGFTPIDPPEDKFIVTTTRSHSNKLVESTLAAITPTEILKVGGAGHKVLLLIEGKAHAYVFASPGCKKWDTCAPQAVLEACGGHLTDFSGKLYNYGPNVLFPNKNGILATGKSCSHAEILGKIPQNIKDELCN